MWKLPQELSFQAAHAGVRKLGSSPLSIRRCQWSIVKLVMGFGTHDQLCKDDKKCCSCRHFEMKLKLPCYILTISQQLLRLMGPNHGDFSSWPYEYEITGYDSRTTPTWLSLSKRFTGTIPCVFGRRYVTTKTHSGAVDIQAAIEIPLTNTFHPEFLYV